MAGSPVGGQYHFFDHHPVNVQVTTDGSNPPDAISHDFNLDLQIITTSYNGDPNQLTTPEGYQGIALLEEGGHQLVLLHGDIGVRDNNPPHGQADTIIAGDGNDTIIGSAGSDSLVGGSGNDSIVGRNGDDTIVGGSGSETISGGPGADLISGGSGPTTIDGGSGNDTISGGTGTTNPTTIDGGPGADSIIGGSGPTTIDGGSGNDTIVGGSGPETISGGPGDDSIISGSAADQIQVGAGADTVVGFDQQGGDRLTFSGENTSTIDQIVSSQVFSGGNTILTLPDGSSITMVGITHVDSSFFS